MGEQNRLIDSLSFSSSSSSNTIDRFRVSCPSDAQAIKQFDSNINILSNNNNKEGEDGEEVWCAVYRSNNNLPSVLMRDDFFQSMKIATTSTNNNDNNILSSLTIDNDN